MFKPNIKQMSTPVIIQSRVENIVNGMPEISYQDKDNANYFCNWKGRGGTEKNNGNIMAEDTAELIMWYRPDLTVRDLILLYGTIAYEVVNIENIEERNQYLIVKVRRSVNG